MTLRRLRPSLLAFTWIACIVASAQAQDTSLESVPSVISSSAELPDAPSVEAVIPEATIPGDQAQQPSKNQIPARTHRTGPYDTLIDPTEFAPHLTAFNKVGMGLKASVSPFAVLGWFGTATYGEAFDRSPNYGQDGKDYLQRIGAASAKASSETLFTTSVLAPILHEDPRYYILGQGHGGFHRTTYALSKIFITRTDKGGNSINYSLLGGNLAGSALTQAYYPTENRGFSEVMTTFGTSLAGSAVKYLFDEFLSEAASVTQLKRKLPL